MPKIRLTISAAVLCMVAMTGSTGAKTNTNSGSVSNQMSVASDVKLDNGIDPRGHLPGAADVSTMSIGKQFDATPNFEFYQSCGRPCWLPFMPSTKLMKGASITDNFPYEHFLGNNGNRVHVICQKHDQSTSNQEGQGSDIWDKVVIPKAQATKNIGQFTATQDGTGFYAFASDLWLGNTGWHDITC